jgi:hypothetical protein
MATRLTILMASLCLAGTASLSFADETPAPASAGTTPAAVTPATTATTPATTPAAAEPVKDPVICKTAGTTGSRLGSTRVCATKSEWDRRTREDRTHMENLERGGFTSGG